jgi:fatty acid desaturase
VQPESGDTELAETSTRQEWEFPTLSLIIACYVAWGLSTTVLAAQFPIVAIVLTGVIITLHSSLTHEAIHGHPTPYEPLNLALLSPGLILCIPLMRFRDTHLDHHMDARLTDPYDDPESNFLDAGDWEKLSKPIQMLLAMNNTLLGRLILGPAVSQVYFMLSDFRAWRGGDRRVAAGWLWHIPSLIPVLLWIAYVSPMSIWAYAISAYIGIALLKIRTFAEHRAHEISRERTVIIEDHGPLAFLFLNNNLHSVHHTHPNLAWYRLPGRYRREREHYLTKNGGYLFTSYAQLFWRHFFTAKDPVPHPLWRRG